MAEKPAAGILIALDDARERAALRRILGKEGYEFFECPSSELREGVGRRKPCIVLLDVVAASANGCRLLKRAASDDPERGRNSVLILADHEDEEGMALCARCGADDFVLRPLNPTAIRTKVATLVRDRKMEMTLREQHRQLEFHRAVLQREYQIAENIFNSVAGNRRFEAPNIHYFLQPQSVASGDLVLVGQKPNGDQRVLLGDFTGHGLTAAIGALPVSDIFQNMTTMGFPIEDMVTVMNRKLKELLPTGLFLAMAVVEFNTVRMGVTVWNGGLPDILVRSGDGEIRRVPSSNLPLAVMPGDGMGKELERVPVSQGDRVYLYSDGLIEAEDLEPRMFGQERLEALIREGLAVGMVEHIRQTVSRHIGYAEQRDDITFIELVCDKDHADEEGYSVRLA
ncbi:PP2C family protein-serine/threonine phosphatase [Endothiovibrio diazotrophicus]